MPLFTDGPPASIEELSARDSQLLNVANVEGIDVTQKLRLAHEEVGVDLYTLLTKKSYTKPDLDTVAVTPPLKLWHAFRALEMVYADAYNSQLNDRYAGKRDQYHKSARGAYEKLIQNGLGIVQAPVSKAATPSVATAAGTIPDGTYFVTMAWVNAAGEEGVNAAPALATTASSTLAVTPVGTAPQNACGWNVYVGVSPDSMVRQNTQPVALGQTWVQPNRLFTAGAAPSGGQQPSYLQPMPRILERG